MQNFCYIGIIVIVTIAVDIFPKYQIVKLGDIISVICYSHKTPKWTFEGYTRENMEVKKKYVFGNVFYIKHASLENEGTYKCHGTRKSGVPFNAISDVYVGCKFLDIEI